MKQRKVAKSGFKKQFGSTSSLVKAAENPPNIMNTVLAFFYIIINFFMLRF